MVNLLWLLITPLLLFFWVFGIKDSIYYGGLLLASLFEGSPSVSNRPVNLRIATDSVETAEAPSWPSQTTSTKLQQETAALRKRNGYSPIDVDLTEVTAPQPHLADVDQQERELVEMRFRCRKLEQALATTQDIPEGKLVLRGRVVPSSGRLTIVTKGGKPFKVAVAQGWEFSADLGDQVLLEALWQAETGWTAWLEFHSRRH